MSQNNIAFMLLSSLYFFLPAYVANMMPVFVKKINFLNYPVDFNKEWRGIRILGDHKTWRGLFFGTLSGFITFELQRLLYRNGLLSEFAQINYSEAPLFLGVILGFSALFGDLLKSFFKRRWGIRPGKPWVPFDQLDFIITAIILTAHWSNITIKDALLTIGVVFLLTMVVQYTGYKLKFKSDKL